MLKSNILSHFSSREVSKTFFQKSLLDDNLTLLLNFFQQIFIKEGEKLFQRIQNFHFQIFHILPHFNFFDVVLSIL